MTISSSMLLHAVFHLTQVFKVDLIFITVLLMKFIIMLKICWAVDDASKTALSVCIKMYTVSYIQ